MIKKLDFTTSREVFWLATVKLGGKTGPYLLYSTIRMKSLLKKAEEQGILYSELSVLKNTSDSKIALELLSLPVVLEQSYQSKSLNDICEYLYRLTSSYNKFYAENHILTEENKALQESWLALTKLVLDVNLLLLDTLAIKVPEKM